MSETPADCLFCKIVAGEIPSTKVLETDDAYAFEDIAPQAPVHVLVVPKVHRTGLSHCTADDGELLGAVMQAARAVAEQTGIAQSGYRVAISDGKGGGQEVWHLHAHVLGGRQMAGLG